MDYDLDYKFLRRIQHQEVNSPSFSELPEKFYSELTDFIKNLEINLEKEKNELKIKIFKDEIENIKKVANGIYELREKKIVQAALSNARGGKPNLNNLLDIEKNLFDNIVLQIKNSRQKIFEKEKFKDKQNSEMSQKKDGKEKNQINSSPIVRVLEDMPDFVGTDMKTYSLKKEDVLSLSDDMAKHLIKRNIVQKVK